MKVLIVSDSHGLTEELDHIKKRHHDVEYMIHCGDSELPSDHPSLHDFEAVKGNCDFDQGLPNELVKDYQNVRIFITHGHLYNVKMSLLNLSFRAKELGANIVCFGHSHLAGVEKIDDIIYINPGSIRMPRLRKEKTYVILEVKNGQATVRFYDEQGMELSQLSSEFSLN